MILASATVATVVSIIAFWQLIWLGSNTADILLGTGCVWLFAFAASLSSLQSYKESRRRRAAEKKARGDR